MNTLDFLRQLPLFALLDADELSDISKYFVLKRYRRNDVIFSKGMPVGMLFIIVDGGVKIFRTNTEGQEHIITVQYKDSFIGWMSMFAGNKYLANCTAMSDVLVLAISQRRFIKLVKSNIHVALYLLELQTRRVEYLNNKLEQLSLKSTKQKFLNFLFENTTTVDNVTRARMKGLKIQELANLLGTARENLSRVIRQLTKDKIIKKCGSDYIIL